MNEKEILEKLKTILSVSKSVKLERVRRALGLEQNTFDEHIFEWAAQFGFEIDREYINVQKGSIDNFIHHLKTEFHGRKEQKRDDRIKDDKKEEVGIEGVNLIEKDKQILKELESLTKKCKRSGKIVPAKFSKVGEIDYDGFNMEITVKNNRITGIGIFDCKLERIPNKIEKLDSLEVLRLINDIFSDPLPKIIGNLQSLQQLEISLPDSTESLKYLDGFLGNLTNLKLLSLACNNLKKIPRTIGNLTNTEDLLLGLNDLISIPESIGNLTSLINCEIFDNKLKTLAESIGNLKNLKYLELKNNSLEFLPESIGNLGSLEVLELENNNLESLPKSLLQLENLRYLNVKNNPIETRRIGSSPTEKLLDKLRNRGITDDGRIKLDILFGD